MSQIVHIEVDMCHDRNGGRIDFTTLAEEMSQYIILAINQGVHVSTAAGGEPMSYEGTVAPGVLQDYNSFIT